MRKAVTCVQPEPTTSDVTRPQQLSPDTTWAEPSVAKSKLAKGSPGLSTTRDQTKEWSRAMVRSKYVYWCISHQQCVAQSPAKVAGPTALQDREAAPFVSTTFRLFVIAFEPRSDARRPVPRNSPRELFVFVICTYDKCSSGLTFTLFGSRRLLDPKTEGFS